MTRVSVRRVLRRVWPAHGHLTELPAGWGIAGMCAGVFCLSVNDALAKSLTDDYTVLQIVFLRMSVTLPLVAAIGAGLGGAVPWRSRNKRVHLLRGSLSVCAICSYFLALRFNSLATANALALAAPIFVSALSWPLLRESVGVRGWLGTVAGFAGVLLILRPGGVAFDAMALLPLLTALGYALMLITANRLDPHESIVPTMFYMMLVPWVLTGLTMPWAWQSPALTDMPAFIGIGIAGAAAWTLITQSLRIGPASVVAPFDYTGLIWSGTFGWLIWGEMPSHWAFLGAAVIAASGIYLAFRPPAGATDSDDRAPVSTPVE